MAQKAICKIENHVENVGVDKIDQVCKGLRIHPYELVAQAGEISAKDLLEKEIFLTGVIQLLYRYFLITSKISDKDIAASSIDTYGIGLREPTVLYIKDISTNKPFVQGLVELCNQLQADPIHLREIIDDALFEMKM